MKALAVIGILLAVVTIAAGWGYLSGESYRLKERKKAGHLKVSSGA